MKTTILISIFTLCTMFSGACDAGDGDGGGTITGVTAGTGLEGGGVEGDVTLSADTGYLQERVEGTCTGNTAVQTVNDDGTVVCSGDMAPADHDHGVDYATAGHDHDADYAAAGHNHDGDYVGKAAFTGHNNASCADDTGFLIIGNEQEEFGCNVTCGDMCARHGMTCTRAYTVSGAFATCTSVSNNTMLYCWCRG